MGQEPARCARCDAEVDVDWVDVTSFGSARPTRIAGRTECPNGCVDPCCPTCRRDVGDIHGPHCGDTILDKLGNLTPCTIDRRDVRLTV